jgi:hypothetical protein
MGKYMKKHETNYTLHTPNNNKRQTPYHSYYTNTTPNISIDRGKRGEAQGT